MHKRVNSVEKLKERSINEGIINNEEYEEIYSSNLQDEYSTSEDGYDIQDNDEQDSQDIENSVVPEEHEDISYEIEIEGKELKFGKVYHAERAEKFDNLSDGEMGAYANVALEYFGNRCALSGEEFIKFDEKTGGRNSNLSAEHMVALVLGGNDIVPNIVPAVLQYNIQKNGYNTIDWWKKARDINGKYIYSPYRLLKVTNFMLKSLSIRKESISRYGRLPSIEEYREKLLEENDIDRLLKQIEKRDEQIENNEERRILSDTITATTIDVDQKKILTQIPSLEKGLPTAKEQSEITIRYTENQFLFDAIEEISKEKELAEIKFKNEDGINQSLLEELEVMFKEIEPVISFENKVRTLIVKELDQINIDNARSVAQLLLNGSGILERINQVVKDNGKDIYNILDDNEEYNKLSKNISEFLVENISKISEEFTLNLEEAKSVFTYMPLVISDKNEMENLRKLILFQKDSKCSLIEILSSNTKIQISNIMEIENWCEETFKEKTEYMRRMPRSKITGVKTAKNGEKETEEQRELRLGIAINHIQQKYKDKSEDELTEVEKELLGRLEKIKKEYGISSELANIMEIENWCEETFKEKPEYMRRMPRSKITGVKAAKNGEKETEEQRELRLGKAINNIQQKYKDKSEDELTEVEKELLGRLEKIKKEYGLNLVELGTNIMEIESWCEETFKEKPEYMRRIPRSYIAGVKAAKNGGKETEEQRELRLGMAISTIEKKYKDKSEDELTEVEKELLGRLEKIKEKYMSPEQKRRANQKEKSKQKTHQILVEQKQNGEFVRNIETAEIFENTIRQAEHNSSIEARTNLEER